MDTKTHFFFDLEETLITDWHDPVLTNVQRVREWIKANGVTEAGIFSWAIWDEKDVNKFNLEMKRWLEDAFGFKVTQVVIKRDAVAIAAKHKGLRFDINDPLDVADMASIFGKHGIFTEFCFATFQVDCTCVLLDDVVPNRTIFDHNSNLTVKLVNVTDI